MVCRRNIFFNGFAAVIPEEPAPIIHVFSFNGKSERGDMDVRSLDAKRSWICSVTHLQLDVMKKLTYPNRNAEQDVQKEFGIY